MMTLEKKPKAFCWVCLDQKQNVCQILREQSSISSPEF